MNNVVLPFLMSMLLGRTIDLTTYTISGSNVYDDADYEETTVNTSQTLYHVIQDNFPYTYFGLPVDIVLRIKTNYLSSASGAMGLDGVLKDTSWKYNSVIVSVASLRRTVIRTLKDDAPLLPEWSARLPTSQTHYAKSLFYGGWSFVLFRFKCDITSDVESVKKVITKHLGVVGSITNVTLDQWHEAMEEIEANEDIRGSVQISSYVYSTVSLKNHITTLEDLVDSIEGLPETIGPVGMPLFMDLKPLHDLDERFPVANESLEMLAELEKIDEMLDDVKNTKVRMMRWMAETMTVFEDDEEEKIATMLDALNECLRAITHVGSEASLFKTMNRNILETAFQKYVGGLERGIANYNLAYRRLKEEIDAECDDSFLHKIRGLLRVYDQEVIKKGTVDGGLQECQRLCTADERCRSIGYAKHASELDLSTGLYYKKEKQCWIYYRSTSTATVHTPNGLSGDLGVYDRKCY